MEENLNKLENEILELSKNYFDEVNKNNSFVPYISKVPVAGRVLDNEDQEILIKSSLEMWLTAGRFTEEFEKN